jgi:hypothetical protein
MRIATLRFHWVVPPSRYSRDLLDSRGTAWKDLWGFVTTPGTARSCLLGLTAPLETFPLGHETFFIVAGTTVRQSSSLELIKEKYPEIEDIRGDFSGNRALIDCKKAERLLGWKEEGFPWTP